jgi:hypothetical protein
MRCGLEIPNLLITYLKMLTASKRGWTMKHDDLSYIAWQSKAAGLFKITTW